MEIWKDILGYEGYYQVSNLGRVYSLPKSWTAGNGVVQYHNGKILKQTQNHDGYLRVNLYRDKISNSFTVHTLVACAFLNHKPNGFDLVVDHIDGDRTNNSLYNIQLLTNRQNIAKGKIGGSSNYTGVYFHTKSSKYISRILINGKRKYLGSYDCEYEAHLAYQKELKNIEDAKM